MTRILSGVVIAALIVGCARHRPAAVPAELGRLPAAGESNPCSQPLTGDALARDRARNPFHQCSPMYVVDGVLFDSLSRQRLASLNIAQIEVVTPPASVTRFGSRAAYGVLVITTKPTK
jgi:hypothetical protein